MLHFKIELRKIRREVEKMDWKEKSNKKIDKTSGNGSRPSDKIQLEIPSVPMRVRHFPPNSLV